MDGPWEITRQRQTIANDPMTDTYTPVIEVTFRTKAGDVASINVPTGQYNGATVREKVQEMVDHLNAARGIPAGD